MVGCALIGGLGMGLHNVVGGLGMRLQSVVGGLE